MISCTKGLQLVLGTACMHVKTIGILILGESENNGEKPRRSCPLYLAACMVSVEEKNQACYNHPKCAANTETVEANSTFKRCSPCLHHTCMSQSNSMPSTVHCLKPGLSLGSNYCHTLQGNTSSKPSLGLPPTHRSNHETSFPLWPVGKATDRKCSRRAAYGAVMFSIQTKTYHKGGSVYKNIFP